MAIDYKQLQYSGFLDYNSYRSTAVLPTGTPAADFTINVGLVFERANDPTALLNGSWASRQQQIAELTNSNTLWSTYGADSVKYQLALSTLATLGISTIDEVSPVNGYVSSAANRTIWVQLDSSTFQTLFNTSALQGTDPSGNPINFWNGNLSLPTSLASLGIKGLEFDSEFFVVAETGADQGASGALLPNPGPGTAVTLPQGPQSPGNDAYSPANAAPQSVAFSNYNYPLNNPSYGTIIATGAIGLLEPQLGAGLPGGSDQFQPLLTEYLQTIYNNPNLTAADVTAVAPGGYYDSSDVERALDVGVVAAINPQSPQILYAGSGTAANANSDTYTAYQAAIWDTVNNPQVITSSWGNNAEQPGAGSPFWFAASQLFVDAALRNITVLTANSDGGSGDNYGSGVTNVQTGQSSPYGLTVGGTSLASPRIALTDPTLNPPDSNPLAVAINIVPNAQSNNLATLWQLVRGGMVAMPYLPGQDPSSTATLIETVWNDYYVIGSAFASGDDYISNNASTGGVDPTQAEPNYQLAYGLVGPSTPRTPDPAALTGRATPDVSAMAGGDTYWYVPKGDMTGLHGEGGTSSSTPAWAALISQFDAVFHDQGLPQLGYMNDLLYLAAAIFPAAFNDITVGNNTSSFTLGGTFSDEGVMITPTGFGYEAGPGYDMTTGLGSPNGLLLARTLSNIAHAQMYFADVPPVLASGGPTAWQAAVAESLLFQVNSSAATTVALQIGGTTTSVASAAAGAYAWTNQFAQQTLQADFDPNLVILFDGQAQGTVVQSNVANHAALGITIASATTAPQGTMTSPFGFVTFADTDGNTVQVARPVAVAETAGAQNDQMAILRIRHASTDSDTLGFYRVDDYTGSIGGLHPGDAGYAAAAEARAYHMTSGGTSINTLSYGQYQQTALEHVNAGDLIAMKLTNNTTGNTYWSFSQANEVVDGQHVAHLWNYGANTWGWEDGSGPYDFNDPVFQLDFTSASGQGLLVGSPAVLQSTTQGNNDLLLQSADHTATWTINGMSVAGGGILNELLQPGWAVLGTGDFAGDGSNAILLQSGQQLAEWQISGQSVVGGGSIGNLATDWRVAAIGDLNGNGHDGLVLQYGQQLLQWQMDGTSVVGGGDIGTMGPGWSIAGIGDLNADGRDDFLLQNGQQLAAWLMNGTAVIGGGDIGTLNAGWSVAGTGDFNGDGTIDLLLQNGQQLAEWQMNATSVVGGGNIGTMGAGWNVAGVGYFNGDGNADILLQKGQQLAVWQMNGTSVIADGDITPLGPGWSLLTEGAFA